MRLNDTPHFELQTSIDLFEKSLKDFEKLNNLVNSYDLFNFLCTINHVYDWVQGEGGLLPDRSGYPLKHVRLLTNRAKHFNKVMQRGKRQPEIAPATVVARGYGTGRFGKGGYGVGEPSYIVEIDGASVSILKLCEDAIDAWKAHFTVPIANTD